MKPALPILALALLASCPAKRPAAPVDGPAPDGVGPDSAAAARTTTPPAATATGETAASAPGKTAASATGKAAPDPVTRASAAKEVAAQRQASRAALERDDLAADAAARLALVGAYLAWADAHPSERECLPKPERPQGKRSRVMRTVANERWAARDEARRQLACAAERGGDQTRIRALRQRLEVLDGRAAAACEGRGLRPMQGNVARLAGVAPKTSCPGPPTSVLATSPIDRVLGIERAPEDVLRIEDLSGIGIGQAE